MTLRPTSIQKSPRMVPGALACGLVAPIIVRPVATTFLPSHTYISNGIQEVPGQVRLTRVVMGDHDIRT